MRTKGKAQQRAAYYLELFKWKARLDWETLHKGRHQRSPEFDVSTRSIKSEKPSRSALEKPFPIAFYLLSAPTRSCGRASVSPLPSLKQIAKAFPFSLAIPPKATKQFSPVFPSPTSAGRSNSKGEGEGEESCGYRVKSHPFLSKVARGHFLTENRGGVGNCP